MQNNTVPAQPESDWNDLYETYLVEDDDSKFWDLVIARQFEDGDDLDAPSKQARELIDQLSEENFDVDLTPAWTAARNRFLKTKPQAVQPAPQTSELWNDAELTGEDCPAWATLLDMPVHITMGRQFTAKTKKRQSTKDDQWNGAKITWRDLIDGAAGQAAAFQAQRRETWGLSRHVVGQKDGSGYVLGNCNTQRRAASVTSVCALGIDADTGHFTFEEACELARGLGVAFIAYTTHSHLSTTLRFKRDALIDHAGCDNDPTLDQVKAYAADKKKLAPHIVDSIEIEDPCEETPEGWMIRVKTAPIPKFRLIFPLAEGDVRLTTLANKQKDAQAVVAAKIRGLSDMLGIPTDPATLDVSRFFFGPRHARGAEHYTVIHRAPPISFADIPANEDAKTSSGARSRRPDVYTKDKLNISALNDRYAKRWELARMFEDADLGTSATADNSVGKFHVRCPFAGGHTDSSDDSATCAWDADPDGDGAAQFASIKCQHGSCQHRHRVDFLAAWIDNGELDPSWLEDPAYMVPFADGQAEEKFFRKTPEEAEGVGDDRMDDLGTYEDTDAWLPKPYMRGKDMIFLEQTGDDGDKIKIPVCGAFDVLGRTADKSGTADAGRVISFMSENGKRVTLTISRAELYAHPLTVWEQLADAGMTLAGRDKKAQDRVLNLLAEMTPQRLVTTLTTPGMIRNDEGHIVGYMLPTGRAIMSGGGSYRLHEDAMVEDKCSKGTLEGYSAAANAALSHVEDNPYWTLESCSAYAGPLLDILGWNPLGFNFSGETSKGKSLGQMLCSAAWANPADGKGTFWGANGTPNAWEDLAVFGSGNTLSVDELGAMQDKRVIAPLMFALHSGRGKARKRGNGAGLTKTATFRPFVLFSSESSIKAEVEAAGVPYRGGMAVRFPDVDVTSGKDRKPEELAKLKACKKHYGHAGPAFVHYLFDAGICDDPVTLEKEVDAIVAELAEGKKPGIRRAARPFAIVQRAGELACDAGLLNDVEAVRRGVALCWETFLKSDEAATANGSESLMDGFVSWVNSQLDVTILPASGVSGATPPINSDGRGRVIGWYTDDQIILDWKAMEAMDIPGTYGKRAALCAGLAEIEALDRSSKDNTPYTSLPTEVGALPDGTPRNIKNMRIWRDKLGV